MDEKKAPAVRTSAKARAKVSVHREMNHTRVAPDGAAPPGAEASSVTSAFRRAPGGAVRRQDPPPGSFRNVLLVNGYVLHLDLRAIVDAEAERRGVLHVSRLADVDV